MKASYNYSLVRSYLDLVLNLFCSFLKYTENENIATVKIGWALKTNFIGPITKDVTIVAIEMDWTYESK